MATETDSNDDEEVRGADVLWVVDVTFPATHRLTVGYRDFDIWIGSERVDWSDLDSVESYLERRGDELHELTGPHTWHDMDPGAIEIGSMRRADDES